MGGGGSVRWWGGGGLLDVEYVEGVRWGEGYVGGGRGVRVRVTTYWSPLDERVRSSFAEKRNVESRTSTREDRSKTAQILLEKPFKNHRKK